jgi:hypothetical protein
MLCQFSDAKPSLLEIEHLRRGLDILQVNPRGQQPLDKVIFDDGDGGIIPVGSANHRSALEFSSAQTQKMWARASPR